MVRYMHTKKEVSTNRRWWGGLGLGWDVRNTVTSNVIDVPVWQRVIIRHVVIAHVSVL